MYLEKLEISGFKSFAHKTSLVFPKPKGGACGISVVVGPNGSGKSNITDAIRWALGEQSLKILRGKKTEDVIFSGSDKKARLGMAEVSLYMNNEDSLIDIDYPEVVITRRVYRDGSSDYLINKNQVRLQDILMLAAKANFGQKSYSVVGQGMVDSILNATPAERKEFFDEAVGVRQFQIKRDQSINKLENAWKNLKQAEAVLEEIDPRLRSLSRQVKRLERREELEKELVSRQRTYYGTIYLELVGKQKELKPKYDELNIRFQKKGEDLAVVQEELNSLEKEDSRTEIFNQLQKSYQKIIEEKNALKERQIILENKIELAKHKEVARAIPLRFDEVLERLKKIQGIKAGFLKKIEAAKSIEDLKAIKADSKEIAEEIDGLIFEIEKPKVEKQLPVKPDPELTTALRRVEGDISGVEKRLEAARAEIDGFNKKEEQKKGKFFELQRRFQERQGEYNALSRQLSEIRVELAKFETRMEDLTDEIREELSETEWVRAYRPESGTDKGEVLTKIHSIKHQLELIGGIDPETVKEYKETKERFDFLDGQCRDLKKSIEDLKNVIQNLDDTIHKQFNSAFKNINKEFQKYFKVLFSGGKAEIVLIRETEEEEKKEKKLEAAMEGMEYVEESEEDKSIKKLLKGKSEKIIKGIEIIATPPGKKVRSISMLSGGERALASIGLICAIIASNPSPFVVLDEVDAALDEANSERLASIVEELSKKTQFIVITHNRATMQRATLLYGVTMGDDGISKLLSLRMEDAEKLVNR